MAKLVNFHQLLLPVLLIVLPILLSCHECYAIRLNPNGGYDIVIGVESNTPEPRNVLHFLDEIRLGVDTFSEELWKSTKHRFFINSVDVLVPGNWWTLSNFHTASWQTLDGSEFRISSQVAAPNVVNPNPCGGAGLYVDLPDTFFQTNRTDEYGPVGKALVNLWVRYRFGVWEEHGIPGETRFPYFYTEPSHELNWRATGCSNEELLGTFRTVDGEISERCDPYSEKSPDDDCRFFPSASNTANSSLLHLHWLDSVTEFCDSDTHDHGAPNRHNLFCGHKSVWEVIRESDDYKSTKMCTEVHQRPEFRVMKESRMPEFYILLDRGSTVTPEKVLQEVMGALVQFVGERSLDRVSIAVGTFPHTNQGKDHSYVKEEVGWAPISDAIYDVQRVLEGSADPEGPVMRDFGLAIQEVAEKIKLRNHHAGTVILVVKRGAGPNTFDKLTFEQEVIASIREDNRVRVFAIEAQQAVYTPYTNLQSLVESTFGDYHLINDTMNTAKKMQGFLANMQFILEQPSIMNFASTWVTQKQFTTPHEAIEIPIHDEVNLVHVHLTTSRHMRATEIYLEQVSGEYGSLQELEKAEWNENADLQRRHVFSYTIRSPKKGSLWTLKHGCPSEKAADCTFFLMVTAESGRPSPSIFNSLSIVIDVSTSAEHNYVDLQDQGLKVVPFAVFAKVEMELQRVLGLENVTALIRLQNDEPKSWTIPLVDDGRGLPDVSDHDGIYSAVFIPPADGIYKISVTASGMSGDGNFQDIRIVNHAGSLMPQDQVNFGCKNSTKVRCISAVPRGSFSRVQDMPETVAVENAATLQAGKPMKILDFSATAFPNFGVRFAFTSPRLLGSDESPDEFRIYSAPKIVNFLESTDTISLSVTEPGAPQGTHISVDISDTAETIAYYAVEAVYGEQRSGLSNIVGVATSKKGTPSFPLSSSATPTTEYPFEPLPTTTEEPDEPDESPSSTPQLSQDFFVVSTTASTTDTPSTTSASSYEDFSSTLTSSSATEQPLTTPHFDDTTPLTSSTTEIPSATVFDDESSLLFIPMSTTIETLATTDESPTTHIAIDDEFISTSTTSQSLEPLDSSSESSEADLDSTSSPSTIIAVTDEDFESISTSTLSDIDTSTTPYPAILTDATIVTGSPPEIYSSTFERETHLSTMTTTPASDTTLSSDGTESPTGSEEESHIPVPDLDDDSSSSTPMSETTPHDEEEATSVTQSSEIPVVVVESDDEDSSTPSTFSTTTEGESLGTPQPLVMVSSDSETKAENTPSSETTTTLLAMTTSSPESTPSSTSSETTPASSESTSVPLVEEGSGDDSATEFSVPLEVVGTDETTATPDVAAASDEYTSTQPPSIILAILEGGGSTSTTLAPEIDEDESTTPSNTWSFSSTIAPLLELFFPSSTPSTDDATDFSILTTTDEPDLSITPIFGSTESPGSKEAYVEDPSTEGPPTESTTTTDMPVIISLDDESFSTTTEGVDIIASTSAETDDSTTEAMTTTAVNDLEATEASPSPTTELSSSTSTTEESSSPTSELSSSTSTTEALSTSTSSEVVSTTPDSSDPSSSTSSAVDTNDAPSAPLAEDVTFESLPVTTPEPPMSSQSTSEQVDNTNGDDIPAPVLEQVTASATAKMASSETLLLVLLLMLSSVYSQRDIIVSVLG